MLELRDIVGSYGDSVAVRNVSITVPSGSTVALLGPNGAGKSTTLRIASGVMRPRSGTVLVDGQDITKSASFQRTRLGLCHLPEGRGVFPSLTVQQNVGLFAANGREAEAMDLAASAFPVLGNRRKQVVGTMSGGEQQMLALSRAYVNKPRVVLVDEASFGLAPLIVDEIFAFLKTLNDSGVALLMVEQYVARALELADRVYVMQKGEIVFGGPTEDLDSERLFGMYAGGADVEGATR